MNTMRYLAIAFIVLIMGICTKMEDMDSMESTNILDDILVYPVPVPEAMVVKRETSNNPENFKPFLLEKLTQHTEALKYIIKEMDHQEDMTKQVMQYLSTNLNKPKLPVTVEPEMNKERSGRRSNSYDEKTEHPVLRLGKNIPIYGRLVKDLFMKEIQSGTDPTPLVEIHSDERSIEYSRRSMGGNSGSDPNQQNKTELSPWCEAAILCNKTAESICGFDDSYGYGKFEDLCHMLHVNCYYKYNFALIHTCQPTI